MRLRGVVVLLALGLAAAACGGGSRRGRTASSTSTTRPSTTTTTLAPPPTTTPAPSTTPTTRVAAPATHPPAPASSTGSLAGKTIAVDPGHNGANGAHAAEIARAVFIGTQTRACDNTGTQTNDGYTESSYDLDVALRLRDVLTARGARVVMTRTTNTGWGPCIDTRAQIGNDAHADAAISIHADGGPANGRGFHVNTPALIPGYTDDIYTASKRLGLDLRDAFRATGMPTSTYLGTNGMIERRDFGGLNLSNVPKVLFETANMRNATDASLLEDPGFRQREAVALADGFAAFLAGR